MSGPGRALAAVLFALPRFCFYRVNRKARAIRLTARKILPGRRVQRVRPDPRRSPCREDRKQMALPPRLAVKGRTTHSRLPHPATNLPIVCMTFLDGRGYNLAGVTGRYLTGAGVSIAACLLLVLVLRRWSPAPHTAPVVLDAVAESAEQGARESRSEPSS